mmetsp:Transcript_12514/g.23939  ORF Transcript_12514/g.23939 Transcript_12514/m.23939 type:complete len:316 (-) Transcript_12514:367-1314(-)
MCPRTHAVVQYMYWRRWKGVWPTRDWPQLSHLGPAESPAALFPFSAASRRSAAAARSSLAHRAPCACFSAWALSLSSLAARSRSSTELPVLCVHAWATSITAASERTNSCAACCAAAASVSKRFFSCFRALSLAFFAAFFSAFSLAACMSLSLSMDGAVIFFSFRVNAATLSTAARVGVGGTDASSTPAWVGGAGGSSYLIWARVEATRCASLKVGRRVRNGILRSLGSERCSGASSPAKMGLPLTPSACTNTRRASCKCPAHARICSLMSRSSAASLCLLKLDPADLIFLPPAPSLVDWRPPALARITYLWNVR